MDAAYAAAFRARVGHLAPFVRALNDELNETIDLLAVRQGTKFDFVMKRSSGSVLGVLKPMVSSSGSIVGVHVQMAVAGHGAGEFGFSPAEIRAASELVGAHMAAAKSSPKIR